MNKHHQLSRGKKLDLLLQVLEVCITWLEPHVQIPLERHPENAWFPLGNAPYINGSVSILLNDEEEGWIKYCTSGWEQSGEMTWIRNDPANPVTFEVGFDTSFRGLDPNCFPHSDFICIEAKVQYRGLWPWFTLALHCKTGELTLVNTMELQIGSS